MNGEKLDYRVYEICRGKRIWNAREIYNQLPDVPHDRLNESIMSLIAQNLLSADITVTQVMGEDVLTISNIKG